MAAAKESGKSFNIKAMTVALVLMRIFLGVKFAIAGYQKWDWIGTPTLSRMLASWVDSCPFGFYRSFLQHTVLPHGTLFTYLVVFGELCIGISLMLGLLTRFSALVAIILSGNFLLASWHLGPASQGINEAIILISLALLITGAGRVAGIDQYLARTRPRWILW